MLNSAHTKLYFILLLCLSLSASLCASTFISDAVFGSSVLGERRLLQAKKSCPVNFEFQNYTIITSKCKGPKYPPSLCCSALKEFACPYADELNDLSNDCASTMFSYINLSGKYPPGLFASECREDKLGLVCDASGPGSAQEKSEVNSGVQIEYKLLPVTALLLVLSLLFV
ncbi:GPI-anchored protein LLG1-like [Salvia hispanica]|uniref:GPI-anchored protein LLG1-like n=1 Tax=Salvia hispanica TaxID=49212 RepID=UPI002009502E|nr:GPI-anchored protein LLG1-like [Salvia hispanica]